LAVLRIAKPANPKPVPASTLQKRT
jgi:hypothetical protein